MTESGNVRRRAGFEKQKRFGRASEEWCKDPKCTVHQPQHWTWCVALNFCIWTSYFVFRGCIWTWTFVFLCIEVQWPGQHWCVALNFWQRKSSPLSTLLLCLCLFFCLFWRSLSCQHFSSDTRFVFFLYFLSFFHFVFFLSFCIFIFFVSFLSFCLFCLFLKSSWLSTLLLRHNGEKSTILCYGTPLFCFFGFFCCCNFFVSFFFLSFFQELSAFNTPQPRLPYLSIIFMQKKDMIQYSHSKGFNIQNICEIPCIYFQMVC